MKIANEESNVLRFPSLERAPKNQTHMEKGDFPSFASFLEPVAIANSQAPEANVLPVPASKDQEIAVSKKEVLVTSNQGTEQVATDTKTVPEADEPVEEVVFDDGSEEEETEKTSPYAFLQDQPRAVEISLVSLLQPSKPEGLRENRENVSLSNLPSKTEVRSFYSSSHKEIQGFQEEAKKLFASLEKKENALEPKKEKQANNKDIHIKDVFVNPTNREKAEKNPDNPVESGQSQPNNTTNKVTMLFRNPTPVQKKENKGLDTDKNSSKEVKPKEEIQSPEKNEGEFRFRNIKPKPAGDKSSEKTISPKEEKKESAFKEEDPKLRSLGIKDKQFLHLESKVNVQTTEKVKPREAQESLPQVGGFKTIIEDKGMESGERESGKFQRQDQSAVKSEWKVNAKNSSETTQKSPTASEFQKNFDDLIKQAKFDIIQNGRSTAEIIMNPKEFGRLTLRVSVKGENVEGRILVDSEEVKNLIQNDMNRLKEHFKESGLSLENLTVDLWNDTANLPFTGEGQGSFPQAKEYQEYLETARAFSQKETPEMESEPLITLEENSMISRKNLEVFA